MKGFILYCSIGVLNTIIGFGIIFTFTFLGIFPELANLLGYCVGIICSFFLNNTITFSQNKINKKLGLPKFVLSMGIAYLVNLCILFLSYRIIEINVYISQILAGASYTLCGFFLSKFYVWKNKFDSR